MVSGSMPMTSIALPPATDANGRTTRWFLDLNGDGLQDVVWLSGSRTYSAAFGTGRDFAVGAATATTLTSNFTGAWNEAWPIDVNLDGREDLRVSLWDGAGHAVALIPHGKGGLSPQTIAIPIPTADSFTGAISRVVADLNADGLPDVVQVETTDPSRMVGYLHQGTAPAMVTSIAEGSGTQHRLCL